MRNKSSISSSGIELCMVLFIVFLVLKLIRVINWSWWWVTSPLWIGTVLFLLVICGMLIYCKFSDPFKIHGSENQMVEYNVIRKMEQSKQDYIDAFRMEFTVDDIERDKEVRKLAKEIRKMVSKFDRVVKILSK